MSPPLSGREAGLLDPQRRSLVADQRLGCPTCHVPLSLPSSLRDQLVTGPCPACGTPLVFSHGRIETSGRSTAAGGRPEWERQPQRSEPQRAERENPERERPVGGPRVRLLRSGTMADQLATGTPMNDLLNRDPGGMAYASEAGADRSSAEAAAAWLGWRWGRWWGWVVGVVVVVASAGIAISSVARRTMARPAPAMPMPSAGGGARAVMPGWGEGALAAWQAFTAAATVEEKLVHVLDAPRVAPVMQAFYEQEPDSDRAWGERDFQPLAGTMEDRRRGVVALGYSPSVPGDRATIVFFRVVSEPAGTGRTGSDPTSSSAPPPPRFLLDWETYIQEREQIAERFILEPAPGRQVLRLAIERVHLFGGAGELPTRLEPLGLKLRTPSGLLLPGEAHVLADSALFERLAGQLRWGLRAYATVQLAWDAHPGQAPRLRATDLICWHFPGLGGTPEFEIDLSPLPASPSASARPLSLLPPS